MKVIGTDNYARDHIADVLVQDDLSDEEARRLAESLNDTRDLSTWYLVVPDDYRLSRGMEDLV